MTQSAEAVQLQGATAQPSQAPLASLAFGVSLEHPALFGGVIDLDPAPPPPRWPPPCRLRPRWPKEEHQVAVVARFGLRIRKASTPKDDVALSEEVNYLFAGGMGSLSKSLGVSKGAKKLLLSSRRALADRSTWESLNAESSEVQKVVFVRELEAGGASVEVVALDVTSLQPR